MKQFIFKSIIFSLIFSSICSITYFLVKARSTSNPWITESAPIGGFYVSNNETLTAAKRNAVIEKIQNRSAFEASWSSTSLPTGTNTKVIFNNEDFDTNNEFDLSSSVFTPKRAGKYLLTAYCRVNTINDGTSTIAKIFKNWAELSEWSRSPVWATFGSASFNTTLVDANGTTDYFDFRCRHNGWSTKTLARVNFSGILVE